MKKEFGPYELAVKLKSLGFDEPCITCYDKLEMVASYGKNVFDYKNYNSSGYMVSRPTFSQAFRWFREKYNLSGTSQYFTGGYYCYTINDMKDTKESNRLFTEFETYEEAELACLTKLIEIVETRTK